MGIKDKSSTQIAQEGEDKLKLEGKSEE